MNFEKHDQWEMCGGMLAMPVLYTVFQMTFPFSGPVHITCWNAPKTCMQKSIWTAFLWCEVALSSVVAPLCMNSWWTISELISRSQELLICLIQLTICISIGPIGRESESMHHNFLGSWMANQEVVELMTSCYYIIANSFSDEPVFFFCFFQVSGNWQQRISPS